MYRQRTAWGSKTPTAPRRCGDDPFTHSRLPSRPQVPRTRARGWTRVLERRHRCGRIFRHPPAPHAGLNPFRRGDPGQSAPAAPRARGCKGEATHRRDDHRQRSPPQARGRLQGSFEPGESVRCTGAPCARIQRVRGWRPARRGLNGVTDDDAVDASGSRSPQRPEYLRWNTGLSGHAGACPVALRLPGRRREPGRVRQAIPVSVEGTGARRAQSGARLHC